MKRHERVKAITALSLSDLLLQSDKDINFKEYQKAYKQLKSGIRLSIFKQSKRDSKISMEAYSHAVRIADEVNDSDLDYAPVYCALNVLFDLRESLELLPKGDRPDFNAIEKLSAMVITSEQMTVNMIRSSGKIDQAISELINKIT